MNRSQIVLPARLASSRLKEKLLQTVAGKTVLQHTYESASRAKCAAGGIVVAVDDPRIAAAVDAFGGRWIMTPRDCPSGTDRIACVATEFPDVDLFVNVQSDEPEIDPDAIDAVLDALAEDPEAEMSTAATPITDAAALGDPGIVKVVMSQYQPPKSAPDPHGGAGRGRAVYFSRACVPYDRDQNPADRHPTDRLSASPPAYWHHLGLYAYRRDFLTWFSQSPPSPLEKIEKLEQLRAIEAGKRITVAHVGPAKSGIDTPADLEAFRRRVE